MKSIIKKSMLKLLMAISLSAISLQAQALLITCEPDSFAAGTDMTNACAGVTLSVELRSDTVVSQVPFVAGAVSTGSRVFGHTTDAFGWGDSDADPERFRADFDMLTSFVSIDLIGNNGSDFGFLRAYDVGGSLLDEILTGQLTSGDIFTASFTRASADIAFIRAAGINGDNLNLDNLQFSTVPEPAMFALLGIGLVGIGWSRRKKV